jgi:hypothetical protein
MEDRGSKPSNGVALLRRLVAGPSPRRPGFAPGSVHGGFMSDEAALGQVFSQFFGSPASIVPP